MPLASLAYFQWYGPGLGAAVDVSTPSAVGTLKGLGGLKATGTVAPTAYARVNSGRLLAAEGTVAPTAYARVRGRGRVAAVGRIGAITQDDVTGAVLESQVEPGVTLREAIRLMLAVAAGKTDIDTSGPSPVVRFRDVNDTANRVTATMSGSERASVTLAP